MLQALKARMQAMQEIRETELAAQRKAALEAIEKASVQLRMKHDIELAIVEAELQVARNRLKDRQP